MDMLVAPLQERMDDWKKIAVQLDKEHSKGVTEIAIIVFVLYRLYLISRYLYSSHLIFSPRL